MTNNKLLNNANYYNDIIDDLQLVIENIEQAISKNSESLRFAYADKDIELNKLAIAKKLKKALKKAHKADTDSISKAEAYIKATEAVNSIKQEIIEINLYTNENCDKRNMLVKTWYSAREAVNIINSIKLEEEDSQNFVLVKFPSDESFNEEIRWSDA